MQVPLRVLLSPQEVGDMSQLQHETKTLLFHRKYYNDSVSIFDYLRQNVIIVLFSKIVLHLVVVLGY